MGKKKSKKTVSVKEIPAKIKEIKPIEKKETLESEVETIGKENLSELTQDSGDLEAPILRQSEPREAEVTELPATRPSADEQANFSQSLTYTPRTRETRRAYEDQPRSTSAALAPILPEKAIVQDRNPIFHERELEQLRHQEVDRRYDSPLDLRQEKPKRRNPWEV